MTEGIEIIIPATAIASRICELGREITEYYHGKNLVVITILNGAMLFSADLIRQINLPLKLDTMAIHSYVNTQSSGVFQLRCEPKLDCSGADVLVIDDILDSGLTLEKIIEYLHTRNVASVRSCVLLTKKVHHAGVSRADWSGFEVDDFFAVGFGLDSNEYYRNLPSVAKLRQ